MTIQSDILVVGGGPIGLITACMVKAVNSAAGITIIEKRLEPTRNHGLKINADSVHKVMEALELTLKQTNPLINKEYINELKQIFSKWSDNFIRTSEIERVFSEVALKMGIKILKGPQYKVTAETFDQLLQAKEDKEDKEDKDSAIHSDLRQIFRNASLIIGADGAHSVVRQAVMKNELADEEVLRYLIEFKFQSSSCAQPRGYFESSCALVKEGNLNFETMSAKALGETKPITVHLFVDQPTWDRFRVPDESGEMKGVYGNSWTLAELRGIQDSRVRDICNQFDRYLGNLKKRGGSCTQEQISTLQLRIYRSQHCAQRHSSGKYVLLVGDAESGLVLERGFNKGLKGVAVCSQIINSLTLENIEQQLGFYEKQMQAIFQSEKKLAIIKNQALKVAESSIWVTHSMKKPFYELSSIEDEFEHAEAESATSCVIL